MSDRVPPEGWEYVDGGPEMRAIPKHNHMTSLVRPRGECPGCDLLHAAASTTLEALNEHCRWSEARQRWEREITPGVSKHACGHPALHSGHRAVVDETLGESTITTHVNVEWGVDGDGYLNERRHRDDATSIVATAPERRTLVRRTITTTTTPWAPAEPSPNCVFDPPGDCMGSDGLGCPECTPERYVSTEVRVVLRALRSVVMKHERREGDGPYMIPSDLVQAAFRAALDAAPPEHNDTTGGMG